MTRLLSGFGARPRAVVPLLGVLVVALFSGLVLTGTSAPVREPRSQSVTTAAAAGTKPNIVMVMADDMRTDDLRFMPSVRRLLVGTGLNFRNSFSPYPLCCPARASFLTGRYAHNHHVFSHAVAVRLPVVRRPRHLATALQQSGYQTGFVGKYLNGYGAERSLVTGGPSFRYVPTGWTDWYGAVERPAGSPYRSGGTYNYMAHALQRERPHRRHPRRAVPDRRAGPLRPPLVHEVPPLAAAVLPLPLRRRPALRDAPREGRPRAREARRRRLHERSRPRPGRAGSAGTFDRQITRASGPARRRRAQRGRRLRQAAADGRPARAQPRGAVRRCAT